MPKYEYIAVNEASQKMTGQAEGPDRNSVRDELRRSGWTVFSIQEIRSIPNELAKSTNEPVGQFSQRLSETEAASITQHLMLATQAGLPLSGALRALSEEDSSKRLKRNLKPVYEALERGEPLEQVLLNPALRLPPAIAKILGSGLPSSAISELLTYAMESTAALRDLRMRVLLVLSYPACMFLATCGLWLFLIIYIGPMFSEISANFGIDGPLFQHQSKVLVGFLSTLSWQWWVVVDFVGLVATVILAWYLLPLSTRNRVWFCLPFVGSMYRLTALSDLANILAVMLECQIPLPQALTSASEGSQDADLVRVCRGVSVRIQSGERMESIISTHTGLPAYLEQILRWAARGKEGGEPLKGLAQMLRLRARRLAQSAIPILEPAMLIASMLPIAFYLGSLLIMTIKLLNMIS